MLAFNAKKPSKVKAVDPDASYSVEGTDGGSFAIASTKKELKQLMRSVRRSSTTRPKASSSSMRTAPPRGWGAKKVGGLIAKFKGKPELSADNFEGLSAHKGDAITGGDIKDEIASLRADLSDVKVSELYGETLIDPKKGLKSIAKAGKKEGYKFDKDELATALNEMDDAGTFGNIELDDAALASLMGMGGEQQQAGSESAGS